MRLSRDAFSRAQLTGADGIRKRITELTIKGCGVKAIDPNEAQ
jgi:hypothetical protein